MLSLDAEEKRTLRYSDGLRHDFKLLQIEPEMLDELKNLGFYHAAKAGFSMHARRHHCNG